MTDEKPSESENNPKELQNQRRLLKFRDDVQAWYETGAMNIFETLLIAGIGLYCWHIGIPFEAIAIVLLAKISADSGSLWRTYVR